MATISKETLPTKPEVSTLPQKDFMTTAMLSLFLGMLGIDRFYLGKIGTGILKLVTFGGFGIWYLIDLIMILAGSMKSKNGETLKGRDKNIKLALIIVGIWLFICILIILASPKDSTNTSTVQQSNTTKTSDEIAKDQANAAEAEKIATDRKAAEEVAKNAPKTSFGSGTFLVNSQIIPGTYQTTGGNGCYYERLSGTSGSFEEIIANENPSGQAIVTIASTDAAFKSARCGTWTKIN